MRTQQHYLNPCRHRKSTRHWTLTKLCCSTPTGKSSLLLRFTDDDFLSEEETTATIGVDFKVKSIDLDGRRYKLSVWVSRGESWRTRSTETS